MNYRTAKIIGGQKTVPMIGHFIWPSITLILIQIMILGLFKSQDAILSHILFSDYYLFYLFFDKPIFLQQQNIGTVFLPPVSLACYWKAMTIDTINILGALKQHTQYL